MNFWEVLLLFFGFLAFLLSGLIFTLKTNPHQYSNRLFSLFLFANGWIICYNSLFWSGLLYDEKYIHLNLTFILPMTLLGPLFFFYIRYNVVGTKVKLGDWFHLIPLLFALVALTPYYLSGKAFKLSMHQGANRIVQFLPYLQYLVVLLMAIYAIYIYSNYLKKYRGDHDFRVWLIAITSFFTVLMLSYAMYYFLAASNRLTIIQDYFITFIMSVTVLAATYFALNYNTIFNGQSISKIIPFIKYKKTGLSKRYSVELKDKLLDVMIQQKPYLNGDLRLEDIAEILGVNRHHTSQIINEHFEMGFFDFLNVYRVEESMKLIEKHKSKLKLAEIGFQVGFNNTVSFNKAFKKNTGVTPSHYRKTILSDNFS